jgi:hypothetical protein
MELLQNSATSGWLIGVFPSCRVSYKVLVASVPAVTNPGLLAEFRAVTSVLLDFVVGILGDEINRLWVRDENRGQVRLLLLVVERQTTSA